MEAEIITFGATVTALRVPDQNGEPVDVVLGYRNVAGYERNEGFVGALVGRYANRIADASCLIDGERVALEPSEGPKSLHGGVKGFSYRVFDAEVTGDSQLTLTYTAADGEGGFPGTLTLRATYTLTENTLRRATRQCAIKPLIATSPTTATSTSTAVVTPWVTGCGWRPITTHLCGRTVSPCAWRSPWRVRPSTSPLKRLWGEISARTVCS